MNDTTPMTATQFCAAFPVLFRRYQDLIQVTAACEEHRRQADIAAFDARVRKALQQFAEDQSAAERIYRMNVLDEHILMESARNEALGQLNRELAEFLAVLDAAEAPLLQERQTETARLTTERQAFEQTCLELAVPELLAQRSCQYEAALAAVEERCHKARQPLRAEYGAKVEQAYAVYNAVLATSGARYADHESGVALDRKRAVRLAERIKNDTLHQIAFERDEAASKLREWSVARKSARREAVNAFLQNPQSQEELIFERFLLDETELLRNQLSSESPA